MTIEEIKQLSDDELRVKIAELCGWKKETYIDTFVGGSGRIRWKKPDGTWEGYDTQESAQIHHLPNYCNDLNIIHKVFLTLEYPNDGVFLNMLERVVKADNFKGLGGYRETATARQRAEAFALTCFTQK